MSASRASRRLASAPWPVYSWAAALGLLAATARAEVVTVTDATWAETVGTGNSQWMVEFYAPWCGHCKAFAPVWEEVAEKLGPSTGLKFAKVDATYEPESAGKFGVKSYPKIFFLDKSYAQDDLHREFKGGRNADAVEKFVHKVIGPPVVALEDRDAAAAFAAKNDITFVLFPAGEGGAFESEYAELGKKYLDSLYLGSCADASLFPGLAVPEVPAVAVLNEGEAWQWHTPASEHSLEEFILATQFPPMVALERKNFWHISNAGKLVLLAVVDPGGSSTDDYLKMAGAVAERHQYQLHSGWLDGVEWEKYVDDLFMVQPEQVQTGTAVIYDAPNKQFYRIDGPTTTDEGLQQLVDGTLNGDLQPVNTERGFVKGAKRIFMSVVDVLEDNPWLMIPMVLPMIGLTFAMVSMGGGSDGGEEKTE